MLFLRLTWIVGQAGIGKSPPLIGLHFFHKQSLKNWICLLSLCMYKALWYSLTGKRLLKDQCCFHYLIVSQLFICRCRFLNLPNFNLKNTVNAVNFTGLIFRVWQHKNIFAGFLIRAEQILTWYFCIAQNTWHHTIHLQAAGQHKKKQSSHILRYITHLHQHTWSIHNSYLSKLCIQNIASIFAGFLIRACWILREIREN